jgi:hypothetical protein
MPLLGSTGSHLQPAVNELVAATTAGLSYVRANLVFTGGTTTATAKVVLSFDKKSK